MNNKQGNLVVAWYLLYCTYSSTPIIAGLDKYFYLLADWSIYLNEAIPHYLHMEPTTFMQVIGGIEIFSGILVLMKPQLGGYLVTAWLIAISINVISMGFHYHTGYVHGMVHYDIAVRDLAMAVGSYVLVLLSQTLKKKNYWYSEK